MLEFTEPLNGSLAGATLKPSGGGPAVRASVRVEGRKRLVITPASELGTGSYRVDWHTVSTEDGHALEGAFAFGVRAAAGAAPAVGTGPLAGGGARIAARIALYTTVLVLAALLLLPLLVKRPRGWPVPDLRLPERPAPAPAPRAEAASRPWPRPPRRRRRPPTRRPCAREPSACGATSPGRRSPRRCSRSSPTPPRRRAGSTPRAWATT